MCLQQPNEFLGQHRDQRRDGGKGREKQWWRKSEAVRWEEKDKVFNRRHEHHTAKSTMLLLFVRQVE